MNLRFTIYISRMNGLALALSWTFAAPLVAQNVAIDWSTTDGGGGDSTGGAYTIHSTIGQSDAGTLSGGNYVIEGGFWSGAFSATPPRLFIVRSGPNAVISWSPATPGFVLQASDSLAPAHWMEAPSGGTNPITVSAGLGNRYFRLLRR